MLDNFRAPYFFVKKHKTFATIKETWLKIEIAFWTTTEAVVVGMTSNFGRNVYHFKLVLKRYNSLREEPFNYLQRRRL